MSSALEAFRSKFEAVVEADTGSGGLRETGVGSAYVRTLSHSIPPDNESHPSIFYSVSEQAADTPSIDVVVLEVVITVQGKQKRKSREWGSPGTLSDFGFTDIAPVVARLRSRLESSWDESDDVDGWSFSTPDEESLQSGTEGSPEVGRQVLRYSLSAAETTAVAPVTGFGASLTIEVYTPTSPTAGTTVTDTFHATTPFAFQVTHTQLLHDFTRKFDKYERRYPGILDAQVTIQFLPQLASTSNAPRLTNFNGSAIEAESRPPGRTTKLTLVNASGRQQELWGYFNSGTVSQSKRSGLVSGFFTFRLSARGAPFGDAPVNPAFGVG